MRRHYITPTMTISSYLVPTRDFSVEYTQTKSRFIATVKKISSLAEMRHCYLEKKNAHPKANHNCWAVIAGSPSDSSLYGFSDDGEPNGTAGKPIFNVLQHSGAGQCCIIVTRYFGGTKLGTGGLVKAYTEASKLVLEQAEFTKFSQQIFIQCTFPYELEGRVRYLFEELSIKKVEYQHGQKVVALVQADITDEQVIVEKISHLSHIIEITIDRKK